MMYVCLLFVVDILFNLIVIECFYEYYDSCCLLYSLLIKFKLIYTLSVILKHYIYIYMYFYVLNMLYFFVFKLCVIFFLFINISVFHVYYNVL